MNYPKEIIDQVIGLKKLNVPHRKISQAVFGKPTAASSVWYILNEYFYKTGSDAGPKILILDIETTPELGYIWGRFKQFIAPVQVKQRSFMLTWSAKWLGEEEVMADAIPNYRPKYYAEYDEEGMPYGGVRGDYKEEDDREVVESAWRLLDEADIVVAHNGLRFDFPYLNSRFVFHGLGMPSPFKMVDTFKIAKKYFRFPANSLKELGLYLGIEVPKLDTEFQLWIDCMEGKKEAWDYMVEYNVFDVRLLEEIYMRLRPYDKSHPNVALYYDDEEVRDPVSGSTEVVPAGYAYTSQSKFQAYRGPDGHVFRSSSRLKGVKNVNSQ